MLKYYKYIKTNDKWEVESGMGFKKMRGFPKKLLDFGIKLIVKI